MRSRIIQPRALFRIAGGSGGSSGSGANAAAAVAASSNSVAATATATASGLRTTPPLVRHHHQHTPNIQARVSTRGVRSSATGLTEGKGSSSAASGGSGEQGAESNDNSNRRSNRASSTSKSNSPPLSLRHPIVPVHPPPHSLRSVALQSFFSQGRPLLEHNNMDAASYTASPSSGGQTQSIAMVLDMLPQNAQQQQQNDQASTPDPQERSSLVAELPSVRAEQGEFTDAEIEAATQGVAEVLGQFTSSQQKMEHIVKMSDEGGVDALQCLPEEVQDKIRAKAEALVQSMREIEEHLSKVDVRNGEMLMPPALTSPMVSLQFHLPPLSALTRRAFNKIMDNAMASEGQRKGPISMHTAVSTTQAFERERQRLINEAESQGVDSQLASALGPESELVVLGEPQGPRAEWGRGVTSYLARHGHPFEPPAAPLGGEEAARVQELEDMTVFDVSTSGADRTPGGANAQEAADHDVDLWLKHALVQEKMKSAIEWNRLVATMDNKRSLAPSGSAADAGMNSLLDLSSLNAALPQATIGQVVEMDSVKRKRKKKMRKMKYKKLRKRQRAERQRLKK